MNNLKSVKSLVMVAALALGSLVVPERAEAQLYGTTQLMNGGTNNVKGATVNSYGTSLLIDASQSTQIALACQLQAMQSSNNNVTVQFIFKQSLDATTNTTETAAAPPVIVNVKLNGSTCACVVSNFTVNAIGYLYLDSINNPGATEVTNMIVSYAIKPSRRL